MALVIPWQVLLLLGTLLPLCYPMAPRAGHWPLTCSRDKKHSRPLQLRPHGRERSHWGQINVHFLNLVLFQKSGFPKFKSGSPYQQA